MKNWNLQESVLFLNTFPNVVKNIQWWWRRRRQDAGATYKHKWAILFSGRFQYTVFFAINHVLKIEIAVKLCSHSCQETWRDQHGIWGGDFSDFLFFLFSSSLLLITSPCPPLHREEGGHCQGWACDQAGQRMQRCTGPVPPGTDSCNGHALLPFRWCITVWRHWGV